MLKHESHSWSWSTTVAVQVVLLAVLAFAAYQPAWHGGFLWDDDAHVTRPELQSAHGLWRIWFDLESTQQYYPLTHTVFWVEQQFFGYAPLGYHLVNIGLHALNACLLLLLLRWLAVPGAFLAAVLFALHPVMVESVAWITELKNTLSGAFYLGAALCYLRFDVTRRRSSYGAALTLFVLALLSKTVTATLPCALLVVLWWRRGRLVWRQDWVPLLPFLVLGVAAGSLTAWVERSLIGAEGAEFNLTLAERCLVAGHAFWFYLGKLVWPENLIFIYPRWELHPEEWWSYVYPAGALLMLAGAWGLRRRWRAPLAGLLYFSGTLVPVLGFFNVYPFRFSFVADHFQCLASLGLLVPVSAALAVGLEQFAWRAAL
jgi:hypothetical protein